MGVGLWGGVSEHLHTRASGMKCTFACMSAVEVSVKEKKKKKSSLFFLFCFSVLQGWLSSFFLRVMVGDDRIHGGHIAFWAF